jgi:O-antigen/teichoic acid export membrane protein
MARLFRHFSLPYLGLRITTASAAVASGLIQTFVLVRVLSPDVFSLFVIVGALGLSLWFFDLGIARILFLRLRARHLGGAADPEIAGQTAAVAWFYAALVLLGGLICFAVMALRADTSIGMAVEFGLFFVFCALNLVWFVFRNASIATDEFVAFESFEAIRRVGHIAMMLTLFFGVSMLAFVIAANLLWLVLIAILARRLVKKDALSPGLRGVPRRLAAFFKENRPNLLRSGSFAASELYLYNFPYYVVPAFFGLGAPTIILDTTFKIFRGAALIYGVGCDIAVPRQTRAYAEGDTATLTRVTLQALMLIGVPTAVLCAVLYFGADLIFRILLGDAVTMPKEIGPILIVLMLANMVQNVATSLLIHTGYFKEMSRIALSLVAAMTLMTIVAFVARLDIVGFLIAYLGVYLVGAAAFVTLAIRGPLHAPAPVAAPGSAG